jgi:hypothetical protein
VTLTASEKVEKVNIDAPVVCPPLDIPYVLSILEDPASVRFSSIVKFIADHIDDRLQQLLRSKQVLVKYSRDSPRLGSILVLASVVLEASAYDDFLQQIGNPAIKRLIAQDGDTSSLGDVARFILSVPDCHFPQMRPYIKSLAGNMSDPDSGPVTLQIIARLPKDEQLTLKDDLITYFEAHGAVYVRDQATVTAVSSLLPLFHGVLRPDLVSEFIPLIQRDIEIPVALLSWVVGRVPDASHPSLISAFVQRAFRSDVDQPLIRVLSDCKDTQLASFTAPHPIFGQLAGLLDQGKCVKAALFAMFRFSMIPAVLTTIANHSVLQAILRVPGRRGQRLQIFSALFVCEEFCRKTTVSDGVLKLAVSSMGDDQLAGYLLKLIGALSSHEGGRALIDQSGLLRVFAEMFLSAAHSDMATSLSILSNIAVSYREVPRIALIISCLMQDVLHDITHPTDILQTLIHLITRRPAPSRSMTCKTQSCRSSRAGSRP